MRDRYSILVGLFFVAIVAIALINGVPGDGGGTLGLDEQPARWPLPEFVMDDFGIPFTVDAGKTALPVEALVIDLLHLFDPFHEGRELLKLGPLVVYRAARGSDLDRLLNDTHPYISSLPFVLSQKEYPKRRRTFGRSNAGLGPQATNASATLLLA